MLVVGTPLSAIGPGSIRQVAQTSPPIISITTIQTGKYLERTLIKVSSESQKPRLFRCFPHKKSST